MSKTTIKGIGLMLIAFCLFSFTAKAQKHIEAGEKAPDFSLYDQNGKLFKMADEVGKHTLVIYFYPKDESMVCTKEACAFRDSFNDFTKAGAKVIGINGGTVASHKGFVDHYKLPFTLLSDPDNKVYNLFGVKKKFFMSGRETFIVDLKGNVVYTHAAMLEGKEHADDAMKFIKSSK
ncbi:peroxiredoxin Q/BCP [Mucilaginibacter lappiensis]|uniref:thioredoxin-dependent peroxiredoxin n=1 Tax=Mucilaginibacter lappiensis TaxID=354630 RepID=A0ABR6PQQ7_9SPHI|nr:peroxiredoxin [Mucilaginibacter lappiensis]MBB6112117.1 peroxiredoxin Q/BCP [Mucilaginibacter lappiensis]